MKRATIANIVLQAAEVAAIIFTGALWVSGLTMRCSMDSTD
jgi:hypothetical protein